MYTFFLSQTDPAVIMMGEIEITGRSLMDISRVTSNLVSLNLQM